MFKDNIFFKSFKHKSIFFKMYISFFLCIIVPIAVLGSSSFYLSAKTIRNNIEKAVYENLKSKMDTVDAILEELNKTTVQYVNDRTVSSLMLKDIRIKEDFEYLNRIFNNLSTYQQSNKYVHSIYIYMEGANSLITSSDQYIRLDEFYDDGWVKGYNESRMDRNNLIWLDSRKISSGSRTEDRNYKEVITVMRTFTGAGTVRKGAVIINIYTEEFRKVILDAQYPVYILGSDGFIVSDVNDRDNLQDTYNVLSSSANKFFVQDIKGQKSAVVYSVSTFNGWKYVKLIPYADIIRDIEWIRLATIIVCLLLMCIGAFFSSRVANRFYIPLKNILQNGSANTININDSRFADEYSVLRHMISTFKQSDDLLKSNIPALREQFFSRLINGTVEPMEQYNEELKLLEINLTRITVILFELDKYKSYENSEQMNVGINKIIRMEMRSCHCNILLLNNRQNVLFLDSGSGENFEHLITMLKSIQDRVESEWGCTVTIGIGRTYEGLENAVYSYKSARAAVDTKFYKGYNQIFKEPEQFSLESKLFIYPVQMEEHLLNFIKTGELEKARVLLEELFERIRKLEKVSVHQIVMHMMNAALKEVIRRKGSSFKIFDEGEGAFFKAQDFEYMDDLKSWCWRTVQKIMSVYQEAEEFSQDRRHLMKAAKYIRENFRRDVSLNDVAEKVNLSPSYFSKIFKENMETSFIDYVNFLRIKEAKKLLRESDITLAEIAQQIGYNNDQSFTRFFKKYEGITPGQFRSFNR